MELVVRPDCLEIRSPIRPGMRGLLAALALVPLLAPYELLVRVEWEHYLNPFFLFAAAVSAGAVAVSAAFLFAAATGLSSQMVFDRQASTFSYSAKAPVVRRTRQVHPLSDVCDVKVGVRDWSEGAPTYHLAVTMADGTIFESGSSWSHDEIASIRSRVDQFLASMRRPGAH